MTKINKTTKDKSYSTPITALTTGGKKMVLPKAASVDNAKYIRNMLPTTLLLQTEDDQPIRGKKGRIRQPGKQHPDILMEALEKVSSKDNPERYEEIMKEIGPGGRGRKHAEVLRYRGRLSFEG